MHTAGYVLCTPISCTNDLWFMTFVHQKMSTRISGHSIIYDSSSSYCSIARSGWHLPLCGVAVVSQVLCTSTTLNKRNTLCYFSLWENIPVVQHLYHTYIKIYPENSFVKGFLGILLFFYNRCGKSAYS